MNKKKWVVLMLVLVLSMGMMAGCSSVEKQYVNLMNEASSQKVFEESGSMELTLSQMPKDIFEGEKVFTEELIKKAINEHRIDYSGRIDMIQGIFKYDFTIVSNKTGERTDLTSIVCKDNVMYIKIDDMISYIKQYANGEEKQEIDKMLGNANYVSISGQDLAELMAPGMENKSSENIFQQSAKQQTIMRKLFAILPDKAFDQYQSNLISKNNNQYTLKLRGAELFDVTKPMIVYSINNVDKIGSALTAFLNSLSEEESTYLGLTQKTKNEALTGIDKMVADVNKNQDKYLKELDKSSADAQKDLAKTLKDSELVASIEKKDAQTYEASTKLRLDVSNDEQKEEIDITFNVKQVVKVIPSIQVSAPTGKIITLDEVEKKLPVRMQISVDDSEYTFDKGFSNDDGFINVSVINGQAYVPLRFVAESMGEKVGWDEATQQAYVERNGQRIIMTGTVVDDEALVRSRDFERLSYKVSWDDAKHMVTIEK